MHIVFVKTYAVHENSEKVMNTSFISEDNDNEIKLLESCYELFVRLK